VRLKLNLVYQSWLDSDIFALLFSSEIGIHSVIHVVDECISKDNSLKYKELKMYDPAMVQPMRDELTRAGVVELKTAEEAQKALSKTKGTSVVLVNSVCGCAAGSARPGYTASLSHTLKPENVYTVFAGVDREAVDVARSFFKGYAPSSPAIALFRDGQLVHMVERHNIEGSDAKTINKILTSAYDRYCGAQINESINLYNPETAMDMDVSEVKKAMDSQKALIFDIRPEEEACLARIPGVPVLTQERANEIIQNEDKQRLLIFHCHHGIRSRQAVKYFAQFGFENAHSMAGGIQAWSEKIDSSIPTY
jgi:putative YphP/YqiW family bacilliredoxin